MSKHRTTGHLARRAGWALAAVAVAATALGTATAGAAGPAAPSQPVLAERMHGEAAIQALGERLPEVAARNGLSAQELTTRLRADTDLWVATDGVLLFVDETLDDHARHAEEAVGDALDPGFGDHPSSDAFLLHSRPGSDRVIHLDFDGHDDPGAGWDGTTGAPYSLDTDVAFSDAERAVVVDVWHHVAEDFAPFDIDVTTQEPPVDDIRRTDASDQRYGTRVVVTPTKTDCTSCGGIAYVGTYDITGGDPTDWVHDRYQPAWVYIAGSNAKHIAEAASHEAGHNLGLSHDGTRSTGYYEGHGGWAPIMGVGYYEPVTQWSRGEYSGANNKEDDFAVIGQHGGLPAADGDATELAGTTFDVTGAIGTRTDVDGYTFSTTGGVASFAAVPVDVGPNLDIELRLRDPSGTTLALADPSGLGASLQRSLAAGTYTVVIDGVGTGDPTTGYSDYGSVGRYRLTGTVTAGDTEDPTPPEVPFAVTSTVDAGGTVTLAWPDRATSYTVLREKQHRNGQWVGATILATATTATSITDDPGGGTFRYTVTAADGIKDDVTVTVAGSSGGGGKGGPKGKAR